MTQYKIVSNDSIKIVNLASLSTSLKIGSEIYSIENNKEITLGFISHKPLVCIAIENATYSLQHYAKKKIPEAENCINLAKKWIEDSSSVSNKEIKAAADAASNAAADAAGVNREKEFIRQGNFILDYLNSNLYLFHLEK